MRPKGPPDEIKKEDRAARACSAVPRVGGQTLSSLMSLNCAYRRVRRSL